MCAREGFAWGRGPLAHHLGVCACVRACVDGVGFSPPKRSAQQQRQQQHHSDRGSSPVRIIILILLLLILPITHSPARGGTAAQERKVSRTARDNDWGSIGPDGVFIYSNVKMSFSLVDSGT